jgi:hypothetical protein
MKELENREKELRDKGRGYDYRQNEARKVFAVDLRDRVETALEKFPDPRQEPQKAHLALAELAKPLAEARQQQGWVRPSPAATLSSFSGPPANTPPDQLRSDEQGRPHLPAENAHYLGRSLFTDFLIPVELGGTLLLVAAVGAIAIAQRRTLQEGPQ